MAVDTFFFYDIIFLILFSLGVVIFLYIKRKNLKREGVMYLYRTKIGLRFIDYVGEKYKRTLKVFSYLSIISGYILMVTMLYFLWKIVYVYIFRPDLVRVIKIAPIMPLVPYFDRIFDVSFLPPFYFTYWIIAIAVIAIFHEFAHGIIAKRYGVKIKTTGFGFLGPFLAAFVEPDEKQMQKKTKFQQISVLSAGTFTNLILAVLFFVLLSLFFVSAYAPSGAIFSNYILQPVRTDSITSIGGIPINNQTNLQIISLMETNPISEDLNLSLDGSKLNMTRIITGNSSYYMNVEILKSQLNQSKDLVILYSDLPAIQVGLKGVIVQIDNYPVKEYSDLSNIMKEYMPGDKVKIKTNYKNEIKEYEIVLGEDPTQKGRAVIGISFSRTQTTTLLAKIYMVFNFFKKDATDYQPKFNPELIIFIYNLIWWLALINLSVALMNMLPVAMFDGGRMFMLTIWGITGSKEFGENAFKIITYLIIAAFIVLMLGWAQAIFHIF